MEPAATNILAGKERELTREIEISVQMQDRELSDSVAALFKDPVNYRSLDAILSIIEQILGNPYNDYARIVDPVDYKTAIFSVKTALSALLALGFQLGSSDTFLIFPYDQRVDKLIAAKRLITLRLDDCFKGMKQDKIAAHLQLSRIGTCIDFLDTDLTLKDSYEARDQLKLSFDESMRMIK